MYTSCGQRQLQVGNDKVQGQGAPCLGFGSSGLSIELGAGLINVMVRSATSQLVSHLKKLSGAGPF